MNNPKQISIYKNEIYNNIPNRKILLINQQKAAKNISSEEEQNILNQNNAYKNGMIYKSKKMQDNSSIVYNKYNVKNQGQFFKKSGNNNDNNNINNDSSIKNINKKHLYQKEKNIINKIDNKNNFIENLEKNNFFKEKNEMDLNRQRMGIFNNNNMKFKLHNSNNLNPQTENLKNRSLKSAKYKEIYLNNNNANKNFVNFNIPFSKIPEKKDNDINQNSDPILKINRPISNNNNYFKSQNGEHSFNYNKRDSKQLQENKEKEKPNEIIYPESFQCFTCQENVKITINPDSLVISTFCKNGHYHKNIPINEFMIKYYLTKNGHIQCHLCKKNYEQKQLLFYCSCDSIICKNCLNNKIHNAHSHIPYILKNYFCISHKNPFMSFCKKCYKNLCNGCINEHIEHKKNIVYFKNILPKNEEIRAYKYGLEKIKMSKEKFNKDMDNFLESLKEKRNEFNKKVDNFIQVQKDIIDKINNKEIFNYENIINARNINFDHNLFDNYLKLENNFNKQGKFLLNLLFPEDNQIPEYKITNEIKKLEIKGNKIVKRKYEINIEIDINIFNENKNDKKKNFNIICKNINNIFINNSLGNDKTKEKSQNISPKLKVIKNIDNNIFDNNTNYPIKEEIKHNNGNTKSKEKSKEKEKTTKKFEVIQKIENCEKKFEKKEERCITSFALLKNNRIVFTFKGGIIKFYEFTQKNGEVLLIELIRLEEDEYCFNYVIELQDFNVAACSEDGTVKIMQLLFDEKKENIEEKIKIIQVINEMNSDPIYIIKELENQSLVLGCWKNILVYQKAAEYELVNKIKMDEYTFSILEISPNEIIASHSDSKTLTGHNLQKYQFFTIKNIESNENNNILCKYQNKRDIIFVAFDKGINIVSIVKKILIKKIILNEIISSLCPIEMEVDVGNESKKIWGLMLGAKRQIFGENVNYAYSMLQIGFNLNEKDQGNFGDDDNKNIDYKIISRKDRIHYYDINNLQNSIWNKNKDDFDFIENKDEQWLFSSGYEDKIIKILKFK